MFVLDAVVAKENKATSGTSQSSASAPPPKRRRLVRASSSSKRSKDAGGSTIAGNQVEEVQDDGAPPSPLAAHPIGVNEVESAENMGATKSIADAEVNEIG